MGFHYSEVPVCQKESFEEVSQAVNTPESGAVIVAPPKMDITDMV